jgi:formamidopyrimidine-DNA glycosylase
MPEVCEVALTAEILNKKLKGEIFTEFKFTSGRYGDNREKPDGYAEFVKALPLKVKKIDSRGKFMWFDLVNSDNHWYVWTTFGLTGMWSFTPQKFGRLEILTKDN